MNVFGDTALISAPKFRTAKQVADYLEGDYADLCHLATDLTAAGIVLPEMFYKDLGTLAQDAAAALRGEGAGGGRATEPMNYLDELTAAYSTMVRKIEENRSQGGSEPTTVTDGIENIVHRATMPTLARLVSDAARSAEAEWWCRMTK